MQQVPTKHVRFKKLPDSSLLFFCKEILTRPWPNVHHRRKTCIEDRPRFVTMFRDRVISQYCTCPGLSECIVCHRRESRRKPTIGNNGRAGRRGDDSRKPLFSANLSRMPAGWDVGIICRKIRSNCTRPGLLDLFDVSSATFPVPHRNILPTYY